MKKMVIDVESVGLHGEGFAVGWVVLDEQGKQISSDLLYAPAYAARGTVEDREWIEANVLPTLPEANCDTTWNVRQQFWAAWMALKAEGPIQMWADCAWPVEANFLAACVADDPTKRNWEGPYPLHDVATLLRAAGLDPLATYPRLPSEEPAHNPLADARQSAHLLLEAEAYLRRPATVGPACAARSET